MSEEDCKLTFMMVVVDGEDSMLMISLRSFHHRSLFSRDTDPLERASLQQTARRLIISIDRGGYNGGGLRQL